MIRRREKGQTMAEFALIMPVLILLMFGMIKGVNRVVTEKNTATES